MTADGAWMIPFSGSFLAQGFPENYYTVLMVVFAVLILFSFVLLLAKRYKRCPSNRVLIIYGKVKDGQSARCLHGGGAFVWPLIQDYDFLHLDPMQIQIPLKGALSMENIRVNVPSVFTVAIGTDSTTMQNAAVRLLGLSTEEIIKQAEDIIFGQLRQVIASMKIEDINRDREKFLSSIQSSLEPELEKIGLDLINVNITDITDDSGYIEAIGRKAASTAIQQAEIDVAEQVKLGAIGVAQANKEQAIQVANAVKFQEIGTKEAMRDQTIRVSVLEKERAIGEQTAAFEREAQVRDAERTMRIAVSNANAEAVGGENQAKARIAEANAALRVKEAEAYQLGESRHRESEAAVRQAQYQAETKAATALAGKIEAEKRAELEAVAKAAKAKQIVDAEAHAEQTRIHAEGEAAAIFAKLEAQARGQYEILAKKAEGLQRIVQGCGGAQQAFQMMMLEHIEELSRTAAGAISNIKFDKIVVWDSNTGANGNGTGATANFLQSLYRSLPPMLNIMKDIGGVQMPEFIGKVMGDDAEKPAATAGTHPSGDGGTPPAPATDGGRLASGGVRDAETPKPGKR